jgi:2,7-dihydroxy-5-methyl-1-naphthoate 7-O-methyltransferase
MTDTRPVDIQELSDLCTPWCIHVVATLRVAHRISEGITKISDLAAACHADAESLGRVLRYLVHRGVFEEPAPGQFTLNDPARAFLQPAARWLDLDGIGGRFARAWGTLLTSVRTGAAGYAEAFGGSFWEDLSAHPEIARDFEELMGPAGHGTPSPDVLAHGDWESVRTVVDVGGGTGALLIEILRAHPRVQGILVDVPRTGQRASENFRMAGLESRATVAGQSFFDPLPPGADLYLLKSILADWPDSEALRILRRCAEAARPRGRVVILNGVSPDDEGADPDLLMLVLLGGRGRTLSELRALARDAGLVVTSAERRPPARFLVECRPTPQ